MPVVPQYHELFNPLLEAFRNLGGSARNDELLKEVISIMDLSDEVTSTPHKDGGISEVAYRLAWARTYLKKRGLIDNSSKGVWALTHEGTKTSHVDPSEVIAYVRRNTSSSKAGNMSPISENETQEVEDETSWKVDAMKILLSLSPSAFERLVVRVLRESGFDDVTVTGKSGDGGIDGKGLIRVNGILSFHAVVQCKRYSPGRLVTPSEIRDFRGAMQGRTDKGIFITTSDFTKAAIEEATRDGAPPLDLINGERFVDILKELRLGVSTREIVVVDRGWFEGL
ncbi:restriction system protein [Alicyclobacillus vulcanalis]|uniref:Restriction system protein n=1 Tax=Alicyclobacillus vulcanalis TaxID=252246 RepID=A0A1N7MAR1_9BACL|nr:restriction system protein [Alicyclobacillus vulcanalis]